MLPVSNVLLAVRHRYSTVQLITNHDELHEYAAGKVVEGLRSGASGDALLGAAAYILGAWSRFVSRPVAIASTCTHSMIECRFGQHLIVNACASALRQWLRVQGSTGPC